MPLASMTGFARVSGDAPARWAWEARSVNGKAFDLRLRLPGGFDAVEAAARKTASGRFARGSVTLTLTLDADERPRRLKVNAEALSQALAAARALADQSGLSPATADGVLSLRGVMDSVEEPVSEAERAALEAALQAGLDTALTDLAAARAEEGARLTRVLSDQISTIRDLAAQAADAAGARDARMREKLEAGLAAWTALDAPVEPERVAQEAALLIVKADIREEIDRLAAHLDAITALLDAGGAIGRKLDFMAQELNREANTICSKAQDAALTRIGVELKTVIDQFREQAQNIE